MKTKQVYGDPRTSIARYEINLLDAKAAHMPMSAQHCIVHGGDDVQTCAPRNVAWQHGVPSEEKTKVYIVSDIH